METTLFGLFVVVLVALGFSLWRSMGRVRSLDAELVTLRLTERQAAESLVAVRTELVARDRTIAERDGAVAALENRNAEVRGTIDALHADLARKREENAGHAQRIAELEKYESSVGIAQHEIARLNEALGRSESEVAGLKAQLETDRRATEEKLALAQANDQRTEERFSGLAAQVLERTTEKLGAANEAKLGALLSPFSAHLTEIKQQAASVHTKDVEDRATLRSELKAMALASQQLSTGATDLTRALKGDSQVRGAWGEVILERVLEQSGLREGHEYTRQANLTGEDNQRLRPDAVVNLPGSRQVIVDSKLSLVAYEEHVNADNEVAGQAALARHVTSMRNHIKQLSDKEYWKGEGLNSADMVLMFVPIESALTAALKAEPKLFDQACEKRVIVASPTTLLAMLRTIEHTWRAERQNENAKEIVRVAEKLYDKFRGFAEELVAVGAGIEKAQAAYGGAMNKLTTGRGNIVGKVEQLKAMGVRASKPLPAALTAGQDDSDASGVTLIDSEGTLRTLSAGDA